MITAILLILLTLVALAGAVIWIAMSLPLGRFTAAGDPFGEHHAR